MVERFQEWTDPAAELPEDTVDRDQLLTNVSVYWSEFERGGHFAAMEALDFLVGDVRAFFRKLRAT
jgi:epoxide hydrolase